MIHVLEDVDEQRHGAVVTQQRNRLHDRFARSSRAVDQRLLENVERVVASDVDDRAHRFALYSLLVVVEQFGQIRKRLAAAELPQQVNRRAPDRRIGRAFQPFDLAPADRTERDQDGRQSLPGAGPDRKSTRLNSSHMSISYAVFCLKKKKTEEYN